MSAGFDLQTGELNADNLLKCEDEPCLGAALGCAIGIMRHPNGATAIATLPRTLHQPGMFPPLVDVTLPWINETQPLAIFGQFRSSRIKLPHPLEDRCIWAQDLAGDTAVDITALVQVEENDLVLSGALINRVGLSAASSRDRSEPGLLIKIEGTVS